jgi:hypothetical protein
MNQSSLESMTDQEIYNRVYTWYTLYGVRFSKNKMKDKRAVLLIEYLQQYEELIKCLPAPDQASLADIYFVFNMIRCDLLELAFQEKDGNGISMGAYARHAIERKIKEIGCDELNDLLRKSSLHKKFSWENRRK